MPLDNGYGRVRGVRTALAISSDLLGTLSPALAATLLAQPTVILTRTDSVSEAMPLEHPNALILPRPITRRAFHCRTHCKCAGR